MLEPQLVEVVHPEELGALTVAAKLRQCREFRKCRGRLAHVTSRESRATAIEGPMTMYRRRRAERSGAATVLMRQN